ncbi:hypothetical protein HAX54_048452 [Datura stramonium]|uniref:Uncharacterized protein n=1 Tax=Datura stramonium TaxID=4076 RepID=A0ABS8RHD0_DATST|nr:hypothetical protein [Datura stramonium]
MAPALPSLAQVFREIGFLDRHISLCSAGVGNHSFSSESQFMILLHFIFWVRGGPIPGGICNHPITKLNILVLRPAHVPTSGQQVSISFDESSSKDSRSQVDSASGDDQQSTQSAPKSIKKNSEESRGKTYSESDGQLRGLKSGIRTVGPCTGESFDMASLRRGLLSTIGGVSLDIHLEVINRYQLGENYAAIDTTAFDGKIESRVSVRPWMVGVIARAPPTWATLHSTPIYKRGLKLQAKFWWNVMISHICVTKKDNTLMHSRVLVIEAIMDRMRVDTG